MPDSIVSDSGSVFLSDEFRHFREKWGFEHYPSSAHHHQSNGKVELSVKTAKRMLRKCMKSGEDQYLGLLNIRNTPTQGVDSSPAQRLFGRRTKTIIPITNSLLHPNNQAISDTEKLKNNQKRQAKYYNKSGHNLKPLNEGDVVRLKPFKLGQRNGRKVRSFRDLISDHTK